MKVPTIAPSIEKAFEIYVRTVLSGDIDHPQADQRLGFFCGFHSCLLAFDSLAEIGARDSAEGDKAWQGLLAEYDRFATQHPFGDATSTNH